MEINTELVHGNRKVEFDQMITYLFAAGYNANQAYRIAKNNGSTLSRGTVYNRWLQWKKEQEIEKPATGEQNQ